MGTTLQELSMTVHTHPTLCEVLDEAFRRGWAVRRISRILRSSTHASHSTRAQEQTSSKLDVASELRHGPSGGLAQGSGGQGSVHRRRVGPGRQKVQSENTVPFAVHRTQLGTASA